MSISHSSNRSKQELKNRINSAKLSWLSTIGSDGFPNVSPKEIFRAIDNDTIIIANIASPKSEKNIRKHDKVCLSLIDIFVQKGCKIYAEAVIVDPSSDSYIAYKTELEQMTNGDYPIKNIFRLKVIKVQNILAPSYSIKPNESVEEKIEKAMQYYGVKPLK